MIKYVDYVTVDSAKNRLQEYCQERHILLPVYNLLEKAGPDHCPTFQAQVEVNGMVYTGDWALKKREAEKMAALEAWNSIHRPPSLPPPIKMTSINKIDDPCLLLKNMNFDEDQNVELMDCD